MKTVYTTQIDKYYTIEYDSNEGNVTKKDIDLYINKTLPKGEYDDYMFDWLDTDMRDLPFIAEYYDILKNNGYDMNLDNYIQIICPYLPFRHYVHIPSGKFF